MSNISKVYLSRYSINGLSPTSTYQEIENILVLLKKNLTVYDRSNNIVIESAKELLEYVDNGHKLDDVLFDASNNDLMLYQEYLKMFEKVISPYVGYHDTQEIVNIITNQEDQIQDRHFSRHYGYISPDTYTWPNIDNKLLTHSWSNTLNLNSEFISQYHTNSRQFIEWSKLNYEYIDFHYDIESTLHTVKQGTYLDYKNLFSHAMNTLNQAFHEISNDSNQNEQDLGVISRISGQLDRTLTCTRQRKNKVKWDFIHPISNESEEINCEYHFKINWTDQGLGLHKKKKVRIYFGLKSYNDIERKQFKLAHMGKHL
ncbi:MAG: hypothetical protein JKY55_03985 [Aliivibrio sp.]|uniref:hypothetical protein n=1 Tax=Aliivibrio sp. TaxID=1872443 RepID=UPI001A55DE66|nr:hypothetical protein [Aliivibrio sp.]